jgi:hypothetical protein
MTRPDLYAPRTKAVMAEGPMLRAQGLTWKQIGTRFGISPVRVGQILQRAERDVRDAARRRGEVVRIPGMPPRQTADESASEA